MQNNFSTSTDRALAQAGSAALKALAEGQTPQLQVQDCSILLPSSVLPLLIEILEGISAGQKVSVTRPDALLTTQQAADMLGVSRPWLIRLLDNGGIPFYRTGSHRRIKFADVETYRQQQQEAYNAMTALTAQAQALGMGYE